MSRRSQELVVTVLGGPDRFRQVSVDRDATALVVGRGALRGAEGEVRLSLSRTSEAVAANHVRFVPLPEGGWQIVPNAPVFWDHHSDPDSPITAMPVEGSMELDLGFRRVEPDSDRGDGSRPTRADIGRSHVAPRIRVDLGRARRPGPERSPAPRVRDAVLAVSWGVGALSFVGVFAASLIVSLLVVLLNQASGQKGLQLETLQLLQQTQETLALVRSQLDDVVGELQALRDDQARGFGDVVTRLSRTLRPAPRPNVPEPKPVRPSVPDELADSIWLVGLVGPEGRFEPHGTGWTLKGRRQLVTNAHVYKSLDSGIEEGSQAQARSGGRKVPVGLRAIHPDYGAFRRLQTLADEVNPYDVALLDVLDEEANLGAGLTIAADPGDLALGEPLFYLGYPHLNLGAGAARLDHPRPRYVKASLGTMSDPFGYPSPSGKYDHLLMIEAMVVKGASGSPLLDADQEVVGVVFASNSVLLPSAPQGPVDIGHGFSYAARADLVAGIESSVATHTTMWEQRQNQLDTLETHLANWSKDDDCRLEEPKPVELEKAADGEYRYRLPAESGNAREHLYLSAVPRDADPGETVAFTVTAGAVTPAGIDARDDGFVLVSLGQSRSESTEVVVKADVSLEANLHRCVP